MCLEIALSNEFIYTLNSSDTSENTNYVFSSYVIQVNILTYFASTNNTIIPLGKEKGPPSWKEGTFCAFTTN